MQLLLMEISAMLLVAALILSRRRGAAGMFNPDSVTRLEALERNAEQTKETCLTAIAVLQERIESFAHGDAAGLDGERKDLLHAAALLLYAGHPTERVAEVLGLPLGQIEMVQGLQKMIAAEKSGEANQDLPAQNSGNVKNPKRKKTARHGKASLSPIVLTDVVAPENFDPEGGVCQATSNGVAA